MSDTARIASIRQMVASGMNEDELEAMTDLEVQDRFNIWINIPRLKRVRLDSAAALTPAERVRQVEAQGVTGEAAKLIAKIIGAHPEADVKVLKTKSLEYLTARVALLKEADREAARQEETEAQSLKKKDSAMSAQYDGYGRIIPGTLHLDSATLSDAQASSDAYERSKVTMNASRNAGAALADRGDSHSDAPVFHSDAEAAQAAYERSIENLNASRNHGAAANAGGVEVSVRWNR